VASFACPAWQAYVARLYGRLADLDFRVVWVEDDFRYHNHAPLDWGGDFSEAMLARFSAKVGYGVTREQVVASILRPGEPHPWRALWLETWRETHIEVAAKIHDAVVAVSADSQLGLMSSHPSSHSIEGRDWLRLFESFGNQGRVAHRPHFASYQDSAGTALARSSFLLDLQKELRAGPVTFEVAPEIENFPMTPFSKSNVVTWGHMALAQVHGADALLLDLFSFTCQHPADEPWVGVALDALKPGLDALAGLFPPTMETRGVGVLWHPEAAQHARTVRGESISELTVPLTPPADLLQSLGIAVQAREGRVNCLWGQTAWAYSDDEIARILAGGVWLDAEAAVALQYRGFGEYLPVVHSHWWPRETMNYSMEHPEGDVTGLGPGIWLSVNAFERVAFQRRRPGAAEWTSMRDGRGEQIGCALAVWRNSLGGRVAVSALPLASEPGAYTLCFHRQTLVQRLVATLEAKGGRVPTTTTGGAYTFPLDLADSRTRRIAVFNAALDPQCPEVHIPGASGLRECYLLAAGAGPERLAAQTRALGTSTADGGLHVAIRTPLPFCGLGVLTVE
jgi:hypothetical protein